MLLHKLKCFATSNVLLHYIHYRRLNDFLWHFLRLLYQIHSLRRFI